MSRFLTAVMAAALALSAAGIAIIFAPFMSILPQVVSSKAPEYAAQIINSINQGLLMSTTFAGSALSATGILLFLWNARRRKFAEMPAGYGEVSATA